MDTTEHATIKLLVRSRIHQDENLNSYRTRLAQENGLESPLRICGRASATYEECLQTVNRIASLTDQSYDLILSRAYIDIMKYVSNVSWYQNMTSKQLLRKNPPVCPACVAERGYVRSLWDLKMIVACPHHNCWLVDKCPSCQLPIEWTRIRVDRCRCGYSLADFEFVECDHHHAIAIAAKIETSLNYQSDSLASKKRCLSELLEKISVSNLMQLYRSFLVDHYTLPGIPFPSYENAYAREFKCEMFSFGYFSSAVEKWPEYFLKNVNRGASRISEQLMCRA